MRIAFLGGGELTYEFCRTLSKHASDLTISVYSRSYQDPQRGRRARELQDNGWASVHADLESTVRDAEIVFSAVAGSQLRSVAEEAARLGPRTAWYVDLNSGSPAEIEAAAESLEAIGWRFVDAGVMGPAPHHGHATPLVISGRDGAEAERMLSGLGFSVRLVGEAPGQASSLKLLRNLVGKNFAAVVIEALVAGAALGAGDMALEFVFEILESGHAARRVDRWVFGTVEHAERRLKEQEESAAMVERAGSTAFLSRGAKGLLQRLIDVGAPALVREGTRPELLELSDAIAQRFRVAVSETDRDRGGAA